MAPTTRSRVRLAPVIKSGSSPIGASITPILNGKTLAIAAAQASRSIRYRNQVAQPILSQGQEAEVPSGASASSIGTRAHSIEQTPSTSNGSDSPILSQRVEEEYRAALALVDMRVPRCNTNVSISRPHRGGNVASPTRITHSYGRPTALQEADQEITQVQWMHTQTERTPHEKLSGHPSGIDSGKDKGQDNSTRQARLAGLSKVSLWHRKTEYPAIDDTDGEDSEDDLIADMVSCHNNSNISLETPNLSTKLGNAARAIKQIRRRQKIDHLGEEPDVRAHDRQVLAGLEAKRASKEEHEAKWAAEILQKMALPATTGYVQSEIMDSASIATADSEPQREGIASEPHVTGMREAQKLMETRLQQQAQQPTLITYQRIRNRNIAALKKLGRLNNPQPNSKVAVPTAAVSGSRSSVPSTKKRQRAGATEEAKEPPSKRAKTGKKKAKDTKKPLAPQQNVDKSSSVSLQQQASNSTLIEGPTQPHITSEDRFAEIGRQAQSGLAPTGRVTRKRSAPLQLPQPQHATDRTG
ncbi:MAG: hypothetical protein Q9163_002067 [Psora crenata]